MTIPVNVHSMNEVRRALAAIARDLDTLTAVAGAKNIGDLTDVKTDAASRAHQLPVENDVLAWDVKANAWIYKDAVALAYDHGSLTGRGDDDHTIYSLADGTRAFTGVVVGVDPTLPTHLATKEYVDLSINFHLDYFHTDDASDIGGYFVMQNTESGAAESTHTLAGVGEGNDQLVESFATPPGEPGVIELRAGTFDARLYAERTAGTRSVFLYWTLSKRILAGTETLLMTSATSSEITSKTDMHLHASLAEPVDLLTTDRLVMKVYANIVGGGSATTVVLYQEGTDDSHLTIEIPSDVLSQIFVRNDLFDANTILTADSDDTPTALTIAEQTLVGRITSGNIVGLTPAQGRTLLGLVIGTDVLAEQTIGIADNNLMEVDDADAASTDYARFTTTGLQGRTIELVRADLGLRSVGVHTLQDPVAGRFYKIGKIPFAGILFRVNYKHTGGTDVDFNLFINTEDQLDGAGTQVWTADKTTTTSSVSTETFDNAAMVEYYNLWLEIVVVDGVVDEFYIDWVMKET